MGLPGCIVGIVLVCLWCTYKVVGLVPTNLEISSAVCRERPRSQRKPFQDP